MVQLGGGVVSLRDLTYKEDYRSGEDNILRDFFQASLSEANVYWRAVGYFSSTALEAFGKPLDDFVKKGGSIRLITSVQLTEKDQEAIKQGQDKKEVCEKRIVKIIEEGFRDGFGDGVTRLIALLQSNRLDIRIAVPKTGWGIYHEKVGVFIDSNNDYVTFSGSTNESKTAFEGNYENIDVFLSWKDVERAVSKYNHFDNLWTNRSPGVEVYHFPQAAAKNLIRIYEEHEIAKQQEKNLGNKWRHQDEAIAKFLEVERGVLNMATGTGKTRTALRILAHLVNENLLDTIIISTDGNDLLDQWYREIFDFQDNINRKLLFYRHYSNHKESQSFSFMPNNALLLCSRKVTKIALLSLSEEQGHRTLLIHDEVHGLGSHGNREQLSEMSNHIRYRLGLSATPEREYDLDGNQFIEEHIGPVIFNFNLEDAIKRGILAPFNYFPLDYELSDDDKLKIRNYIKAFHASAKTSQPMTETELYNSIARVYKTSREKIPVFEEFIADHNNYLERCIVFVEEMDYGHEVLEIIHLYRPDFHTYFSGEEKGTLRRFATGELECLITCHRVSEGIDIKSLNNVILFSSARAKLETIQRIGRCLRIDPQNPYKIANIIDFIRQEGDASKFLSADQERCDWLGFLSTIRPEGYSNESGSNN